MHVAAWLIDGSGGGDQRLAGDLATEHALTVLVGLHAAEDVDLDRLEVEQFDQILECVRHGGPCCHVGEPPTLPTWSKSPIA